jgi:hypothetical protein
MSVGRAPFLLFLPFKPRALVVPSRLPRSCFQGGAFSPRRDEELRPSPEAVVVAENTNVPPSLPSTSGSGGRAAASMTADEAKEKKVAGSTPVNVSGSSHEMSLSPAMTRNGEDRRGIDFEGKLGSGRRRPTGSAIEPYETLLRSMYFFNARSHCHVSFQSAFTVNARLTLIASFNESRRSCREFVGELH